MVDTEVDCTTVAETAGLACCWVSEGTGICFTDRENEQGHSCYAHKQGGTIGLQMTNVNPFKEKNLIHMDTKYPLSEAIEMVSKI